MITLTLLPLLAAPTLYDRLGIHKIAAAVDNCISMEMSDAKLNEVERFKSARTAPAPMIKFGITAYLAHLAGGPQRPAYDIAAVDKWYDLSPEMRAYDWEIRWKAFEKAGFTRDEFMELRGRYEKNLRMATAMAPMSSESFMDKMSLYARLGGLTPIAIVVDDFVNQLATDPTILGNPHVVKSLTSGKVSAAGIKYLVTEQLASAAGGPFVYTGRTMAASHKGLMISGKEWDATAGILKRVLDKYHVPEKEQGEIFSVIAGTRKDIVDK